jgi:cell division protein FtsQ
MRAGPPLIFGSAAAARAKWAAAARVLADPSAAGATYLDLRIPGRVAAGGLAPVASETPNGDSQTNPQSQGENGLTLKP